MIQYLGHWQGTLVLRISTFESVGNEFGYATAFGRDSGLWRKPSALKVGITDEQISGGGMGLALDITV